MTTQTEFILPDNPRSEALARRLAAEVLGTAWLVFGGCGTAVLAAKVGTGGVGMLGVALAFGLTVFTMAYAIGPISGGHYNPAVTIGLASAGRFGPGGILPYIGAQLVGAIVASAILAAIASGTGTFDLVASGFAANGYGAHSPAGYSLEAGFIAETVLTFAFLMVIIGATDSRSTGSFAPLAIGLALTLIHLISIPVTNTSVNPARSTGPALFVGGWALQQLWMFWVAPILGAVIAGVFGRWLFVHAAEDSSPGPISDKPIEVIVQEVVGEIK